MAPGPLSTRWRIVLEYDGADFQGWGVQPGGRRTVQGEVEVALATLLDHPVRVHASGRTDAGVHALAQVAAFTTHAVRSPDNVVRGLDTLLPDDVTCRAAEVVPEDFDPRRDALAKLYRYQWVRGRVRSPLRRRRAELVRRPLDVEAMRRAASSLVGSHDFASFRASGCDAPTTVRTLEAVELVERGDELHLCVVGHGFLWHMVRIVAGTLIEVGRGRWQPEVMDRILAERHRSAAGRTAAACGLTLIGVRYPGWVSIEGYPLLSGQA